MSSKIVLIRGYGDYSYPNICTYRVLARSDQAIAVIEHYLSQQDVYRKDTYDFQIRTEDDSRHLYCYQNGEVYQDERGEGD